MLKKPTPTLVPGIPPIPSDASPALRSYLTALGEALQVRLGRRGDPRDRAVTLRELIDSGLAKELKTEQFDPNKFTRSNLGFEINTTPNLAVPPVPASLSGSAAFQTVILTWNSGKDPRFLYNNHSITQVYRHTEDVIGSAVFIGSTSAGIFADDTVSSGTTYYYWVKYISTDNVASPFNATSGVAVTATNVNAITSTMITDDAITTPKLATNSVIAAKIAAGEITADKLEAGTITAVSGVLGNLSVGTANIIDLNITTGKVAGNAITSTSITAGSASSGATVTHTLGISMPVSGEVVVMAYVAYAGSVPIGEQVISANNTYSYYYHLSSASAQATTVTRLFLNTGASTTDVQQTSYVNAFQGGSLFSPISMFGRSNIASSGTITAKVTTAQANWTSPTSQVIWVVSKNFK
tara:strand:+ start:234 stop:1466 length:1233 start_codon:yes stop_codon:yes gene_type:complete